MIELGQVEPHAAPFLYINFLKFMSSNEALNHRETEVNTGASAIEQAMGLELYRPETVVSSSRGLIENTMAMTAVAAGTAALAAKAFNVI